MSYSGFWRRVLASIVDSVIFIPVSFLITVTQSFGDAYIQGFFANLVIAWLYFSICESQSWQATLGKKIVGIKVTDLNGQRISFARATGRYASKFLSYLTLGFGFLMPAFTKRKQALHDLVAETLVLKNDHDSFVDLKQVNSKQFSNTVLVSKTSEYYPKLDSSTKIIMAGFNATGHVLRLSFDINDPKLFTDGLIIGRDSFRVDLHIPDPSISRIHARIYKKNDELWIEDMGSTNGMVVNGRKVLPKNSSFLSVSGTVSIGGIDLTLGRA